MSASSGPPVPPSLARRLAALTALAAALLAVVYLVLQALHRWDVLLVSVGSLGIAVVAAWYVVSRRGSARVAAVGVTAAALLCFVLVVVASESLRVVIVAIALAAVCVWAARFAIGRPAIAVDRFRAAPRASHPVLLINRKSGGGKAERFGLVDRCRELGIEPLVLKPGDDLLELAEDAVARGADVIGMAGGDGSQALVASVASRHGIPHVVVPAGTRNHFALDLGLDRDDVVGALSAYADGVDRVIDLAEVNGRVFVNNASMGAYAKIVQSSEYRDAKTQTAAAILPEILGPDATPMDLRFTLPSGEAATTAALILVSNNQYELHHIRGGGTRAKIDEGVLGIVSLQVGGRPAAEGLAAHDRAGHLRRFGGWQEWTATQFEVRSGEPVDIGVDGEALTMQPPLRFTVRPNALTVRLPPGALGVSPAALAVRVTSSSTVAALWRIASGRSEQAS